MDATTNTPGNWQQFLKTDANRTEPFKFLATHSAQMESDKLVITTKRAEILCNYPRDTSLLFPCDHEEADSRMMLHLADAVNEGDNKVLLRTVDTDIAVLAVAMMAKPQNIQELWLVFGTGQHLRYIPAHEIADSLGPQISGSPYVPCIHGL